MLEDGRVVEKQLVRIETMTEEEEEEGQQHRWPCLGDDDDHDDGDSEVNEIQRQAGLHCAVLAMAVSCLNDGCWRAYTSTGSRSSESRRVESS